MDTNRNGCKRLRVMAIGKREGERERERERARERESERASEQIRSRVYTGAWNQGECAFNIAKHVQSYLLPLPINIVDGASPARRTRVPYSRDVGRFTDNPFLIERFYFVVP